MLTITRAKEIETNKGKNIQVIETTYGEDVTATFSPEELHALLHYVQSSLREDDGENEIGTKKHFEGWADWEKTAREFVEKTKKVFN